MNLNDFWRGLLIILVVILAFHFINIAQTKQHELVHQKICEYLGDASNSKIEINYFSTAGSFSGCTYPDAETEKEAMYLDAQNEVNGYYSGIYMLCTLFLTIIVLLNLLYRTGIWK
jgi:hypothetical protein